jgi:hypothetical protein
MGGNPSTSTKHIKIINASEFSSSPDFCEKRRLHYKNEFKIAKISIKTLESSTQTCKPEAEIVSTGRRPSFLEPPEIHDEISRELFHQKSIKSEKNEFTVAKSRISHKKSRSHIEKKDNDESISSKKSGKSKKDSKGRRNSHQPISFQGSQV